MKSWRHQAEHLERELLGAHFLGAGVLHVILHHLLEVGLVQDFGGNLALDFPAGDLGQAVQHRPDLLEQLGLRLRQRGGSAQEQGQQAGRNKTAGHENV